MNGRPERSYLTEDDTLMPMSQHNVQLSSREATVVYTDLETKRILGFGPEGFPPVVPPGTKYGTELLLHASDIERKAQQFREQSLRDRQETALRRLEAERPMRESIKAAVRDRNASLPARQRDINNALLKTMDFYYDTAVESRQRQEVCIAAEKYEATKTSGDVALENPKIELR